MKLFFATHAGQSRVREQTRVTLKMPLLDHIKRSITVCLQISNKYGNVTETMTQLNNYVLEGGASN
jgi:hypothetical protein